MPQTPDHLLSTPRSREPIKRLIAARAIDIDAYNAFANESSIDLTEIPDENQEATIRAHFDLRRRQAFPDDYDNLSAQESVMLEFMGDPELTLLLASGQDLSDFNGLLREKRRKESS